MRKTNQTILYALLVLASSLCGAAIPTSIDYQAYLTNADGSTVSGDVTITFLIYNVESGGVPLWTDTLLVLPEQGLFSVELGSPGNPFPAGLFNTPLFIGIEVDGDGEMLPRRKLTSVGFAFEADNALSLQGQGRRDRRIPDGRHVDLVSAGGTAGAELVRGGRDRSAP